MLGGLQDTSCGSSVVGEGGATLDLGITFGFDGICTGLASTVTGSSSAVIGSFPEISALMSIKAFAAARFAFLLADLDGES